MKRRDLLRYLESQGCRLLREGGEHSIWENFKIKIERRFQDIEK